jgi:RNA polymerase sigma-70 factor, ECF subfamily
MKMIVSDLQRSSQYLCCGEQSEIALVSSAQSGNLESFNLIVLKYQDVMFRTALRILEQDDLAGDATQEAFISAYQHISHFRGGSLKAWLMQIVVNKCYDEM